ncbi:MAG: glycerophosphodiester phosphodiesterase family protein [Prevotellaceae bacterium]|nr:glycerophosphodiester phosphodiesterase family protein [Prevotellaceae bacterium]
MKKFFSIITLAFVATVAMAQTRAEQLRNNMYNNPKYVIVAAHRGDWRNHPENSLAGFQSCIDAGVDMIEIDVQKTKDGILVIMHDDTLDRCSNGKGRISDHTYAELQQLNLKIEHQAALTRQRIPTLEEVLLLCKGKILINVDKGYDYFQDMYALLEKTGTTNQVVIKSGRSLDTVKKENGDVFDKVIYMPVVGLNDKNAEKFIDEWITAHPVAIECCFGTYDTEVERLLQKVRAAGIQVWVNSIWASLCAGHDDDLAVEEHNPDGAWGWILDRGATIIQSDRPIQLTEYLKKHKHHKMK